MSSRPFHTRPWVLVLALVTTGALLLFPGLGSFGLWEPPDSWEPTHRRGGDVGSGLPRGERERFSRPRAEILLAEQARRALPGKAGEIDAGKGDEAESGQGGSLGPGTRAGAAGKPGGKGAERELILPERPPLTRMAVTLGYRIFGVSELAGRIPLVFLALLVLGLTFLLIQRLFDRWAALLGGLVLLGLPAFVLQSRQLTSEILPIACGLMAVGGLGLWAAPRARQSWEELVALGVGIMGLVGGYFARGAVLGVLLPALGVFLALLAARGVYGTGGGTTAASRGPLGGPLPPSAQRRFWINGVVLLVLVAGIGIGAWGALAAQEVPRYSAFLGETPLVTTHALNFLDMKSNPSELAIFDVMLKQLGFAAFPWVALVPLALVGLLWWHGSGEKGERGQGGHEEGEVSMATAANEEGVRAVAVEGGSTGGGVASEIAEGAADLAEKARLEQFGRFLLVGWFLSAFLVGTYWILRFGDAGFLGLPAMAGALGVVLRDLAREKISPLRMGAMVVALAALVILLRDFGSFPQALVSTHVHYQLHFPEGLSLKWPLRILVALFAVSTAALLIGRGAKPPVAWPSTAGRWLGGSGLGLGRRLGFRPEGEPAPLLFREVVMASLVLVTMGVAGAGVAWIIQRPPQQVGPVLLGGLLVPVVLPLVPMALATLVDVAFFGLHLLWLIATGRLFQSPKLLLPPGEILHLRALWSRLLSLRLALVALFALPALGVAFLVLVRYLLRGLLACFLVLAAAPMAIASALGVWLTVRRTKDRGSAKRAGQTGPAREGLVATRAALATLVVAPLALSAYLAWGLVPKLSEHYSYKAIFDTYNQSRDSKRPQPLALWQVSTRSPVFYTRGPLLGEDDLKRRYPVKGGGGNSALVQYLASGWVDARGASQERVYAIVPAGVLGVLDRDTAARVPRVPYYVLDNRNSFYLLLSNRLGRVRRGGRWVAEKDQNPLRKLVMDEEPSISCPKDGPDFCPRFSVMLAEQKGATEPSLEVMGARFPRVIPPGQSFSITLYFRVLKKVQSNFKVFIHIDGMGNRVIADHDPVQGRYATSLWLPGRYVVDRHVVPAEATSAVSTPRGTYTIYAGLFQGDRRMVVLSGPADRENRIILGRARVGSRGVGCGQ